MKSALENNIKNRRRVLSLSRNERGIRKIKVRIKASEKKCRQTRKELRDFTIHRLTRNSTRFRSRFLLQGQQRARLYAKTVFPGNVIPNELTGSHQVDIKTFIIIVKIIKNLFILDSCPTSSMKVTPRQLRIFIESSTGYVVKCTSQTSQTPVATIHFLP